MQPSGNDNRLLSIKACCAYTSLSRSTLWLKVKSGEFPKPILLGEGRKAFLEREVNDWIAGRIAERDREAA